MEKAHLIDSISYLFNEKLDSFYVGVDLGGTCTKIVWRTEEKKEQLECPENIIKQIVIDTDNFSMLLKEKFIESNKNTNFWNSNCKIGLTGGGSVLLRKYFPESVTIRNEFEAVSLYCYKNYLKKFNADEDSTRSIFLLNAGSGASFLVVDGKYKLDGKVQTNYKRIGGTAIAGGTFNGLAALALKSEHKSTNFNLSDEIQKSLNSCLSQSQSSKKIHMTVGDILGEDFNIPGLTPDTPAAFFANLPKILEKCSANDIIPELRIVILANLLQLAAFKFMYEAKEFSVEKRPKQIYLAGGFFSWPGTQLLVNLLKSHMIELTEYDLILVEDSQFSGALACLE